MPDTLVYTSLSRERLEYLPDWIISLRTLGNYSGEALVMYYGSDDYLDEIAGMYNFRLIRFRKRFNVNDRFLDILPVLNSDYRSSAIAHFDADIWFQSDINELFAQVADMDGVLFSTEALRSFNPDERIAGEEYDGKIRNHRIQFQSLQMNMKGVVNGGFLAGRYPCVKEKLEAFGRLYEIYRPYRWNCDQFILNVLFNPARDRIDRRWNSVIRDTHFHNGKYYLKNIDICFLNDRMQRNEHPSVTEVKGIHCNKNPNHRKIHFRFRYLYSELFLQEFRREILDDPCKRDLWPVSYPIPADPDLISSIPKAARVRLAKGKRQNTQGM